MRSAAAGVIFGMLLANTAQAEDFTPNDFLYEDEPEAIYGGEPAQVCDFANAAYLATSSGYCTGTLVHPQVIIYAAHCGSVSQVIFGEDKRAPMESVQPEQCWGHPGFSGPIQPHDIAVCKLPTPMTVAPITPPLMGCERDLLVPGSQVFLAGFGRSDGYERLEKKRFVQSTVTDKDDGRIEIGVDGKTGCVGDSGGPAYFQLPDGTWRVFGATSGSPYSGPGACGKDGGIWTSIAGNMEWIESTVGIDVTPCHDAMGNWTGGPECGGFPNQLRSAGSSWNDGCAGPVGPPAENFCGGPEAPGAASPPAPAPDPGPGNGGDENGGQNPGPQPPPPVPGPESMDPGPGVGGVGDAGGDEVGSAGWELDEDEEGCSIAAAPPAPMLLVPVMMTLGLRRRRS